MLNYTATDERGHHVAGAFDDPRRTRRDVALELYQRGHRRAAIYDGQELVAGIDTHSGGGRYWWVSLKLAATGADRKIAAHREERGR